MLKPMYGALCMSLSSFCVVVNALRLNRMNINKEILMKKEIKIKGMMCEHCQKHVTDALVALGVTAEVSYKTGIATVTSEIDITDDKLTEAVTKAGYEVIEIS